MLAYLDHAATTRPFDCVREYMAQIEDQNYGNPSSMHGFGANAEKEVRQAREILAGILKVTEKELIFTSGGTESNNLALIGCARANCRAGTHLITTKIEHPAVLEPMKYLETEGFQITYLDVDASGRVREDDLKAALRPDTILVSIMHVNNEIGSVQDLAALSRIIRANSSKTLFHADAVQSFGKYRIHPKRLGVDLLSVSGHKIHGPKGVGMLYADSRVKLHPILFGGGQQKGLRSGTENVPGIAGLALAADLIYREHETTIERLYDLKTDFVRELSEIEGITVNGLPDAGSDAEAIRQTAPHVVSASFAGIRAEVLLHALEEKGIYVSSGSACASNKPAVSATLRAIGVRKDLLDATLRFSFGTQTTKAELEAAISSLQELLPTLRKYARH